AGIFCSSVDNSDEGLTAHLTFNLSTFNLQPIRGRAIPPIHVITNPMKLLGIDVGTGGTRGVLIDEQGKVVSSATAEHAPFASPQIGWAEQDPRDWWRASIQAVRDILATGSTRPEEIAAVGLSGQMHGAVLLDKDSEVLRPALIWCDQRTDAQCKA